MDKTVVKAFSLLEIVAHANSPVRIVDVAEQTGWTPSNVHRLLKTLVELGYVEYFPESKRYGPTLKIWEVSQTILKKIDMNGIVRETLSQLAQDTGETIYLGVYQNGYISYVDIVHSEKPLRITMNIGDRSPAYCVATGKAILAQMGAEEIERVTSKLRPLTPSTVTSKEKFLEELNIIKASGFAVNRGEFSSEVFGVAAPVFGARENVVGAIGLSSPSATVTEKQSGVPLLVRDAAINLSARLGSRRESALTQHKYVK